MDLKTLQDTPPWEWPIGAGKRFLEVLQDHGAGESDRLIAAELAGDLTVVDDELADSLLAIVSSPDEPPQLRAKAAVSLGPVLEQSDIDGFEDPADVPITQRTFRRIQTLLKKLHFDNSIPKDVRRRILEASVRAPESWHQDAIKAAYSSGEKDWVLTAVFSMRWVKGFDNHILEALKSADPEIHYEAVNAAGNWGLEGAWPKIVAIVNDAGSPKHLMIAAIGAIASIRPAAAPEILGDLAESDDEDIAEAAEEAIEMAKIDSDAEDDEDDDEDADDEWLN
jgi:HEAT repeat protein